MKCNTASDTSDPLLVFRIPHKTGKFSSCWVTVSLSDFTEHRRTYWSFWTEVCVMTAITSCRQCLSVSVIGVSWLWPGRLEIKRSDRPSRTPWWRQYVTHAPRIGRFLSCSRWSAERHWVQIWSNVNVYTVESRWNSVSNATKLGRP